MILDSSWYPLFVTERSASWVEKPDLKPNWLLESRWLWIGGEKFGAINMSNHWIQKASTSSSGKKAEGMHCGVSFAVL